MEQLLPTIVFGLVLIALAAGFLLRDRASRIGREQKLMEMGFTRCGDETEKLVETVEWLGNNEAYQYSVDHPMRISAGQKAAYFYTKLRLQRTRVLATEELLLPLERFSEEGLLLLVELGDVGTRSARTLTQALPYGLRDWQPEDLTSIEIPHDPELDRVLAALGPSGASVFDLIAPRALQLLQHVGDFGAAIVTCRGTWCSLASPSPRVSLDMEGLMDLVEKLLK